MTVQEAYRMLRWFSSQSARALRPIEPGPAIRAAQDRIWSALREGGVESLVEAGVPRGWAEREQQSLLQQEAWDAQYGGQ
jgi:ribosomal protein RSM22 (predicted rRNA methylase)